MYRRGDVISMHHCAEHYRAMTTFKASRGGNPELHGTGSGEPQYGNTQKQYELRELISIIKSQKAKYFYLFLMFLGNSKVEKLVDSSGEKKNLSRALFKYLKIFY